MARFTPPPVTDREQVAAEFRARAREEVKKIASRQDELTRANDKPTLARLFERYGMIEQAKVPIETQQRTIGQYVGYATQWAGG